MESSIRKFVSVSFALAIGLLVSLLVSACGSSSPTAASTSTAPAITLMGLNPSQVATAIQIGQAQVYMLTVVPTTSVITWTSSNPAVLTVDGTGNATGITSGHATLTASADNGMSATLVVQVVPVYGGTWAGNITVIGCTDLVGFAAAGYCSRNLGSAQAFTMSLTQTNSNIGNVVSGTFTKGEGANTLSGSVSGGNIGDGGDLGGLTGLLGGVADGVNLSLTLTGWNSLVANTSMTGTWAANITSPQIPGVANVRYSLTSVTLVPASGSQLSQRSRDSTSSAVRRAVPQRH
jgi:hypothetical protein